VLNSNQVKIIANAFNCFWVEIEYVGWIQQIIFEVEIEYIGWIQQIASVI
jgi:hypothetical protein